MSSRWIALSMVCAVSCGQAAVAPSAGASAELTPPPNIVLLLADDLGYGDVQAFANTTIRTPNLDQLAAEGTRLTSFYAAPICTPSRAALLTGRYQVRDGWGRCSTQPRPTAFDQVTPLPDKLKEAGYASTAIGKWHLGHLPQYTPTRHGFDQFFGVPYGNDMTPAAAHARRNGPRGIATPRNRSPTASPRKRQQFISAKQSAAVLPVPRLHGAACAPCPHPRSQESPLALRRCRRGDRPERRADSWLRWQSAGIDRNRRW